MQFDLKIFMVVSSIPKYMELMHVLKLQISEFHLHTKLTALLDMFCLTLDNYVFFQYFKDILTTTQTYRNTIQNEI